MTDNASVLQIRLPALTKCDWRSFGMLHVMANAIGAAVCIFYFNYFVPAGVSISLGEAFIVPTVVAVILIAIGLRFQFHWEKTLMAYINRLQSGLDVPDAMRRSAQLRILNLPYISAGITLMMWTTASVLMALWHLTEYPKETPLSKVTDMALDQAFRVLSGTFLSGVATAAIILFVMETLCRRLRPYFFTSGDMVKTPGAYHLKLRARMLITFFLTSVLPLGVMAHIFYHKATTMVLSNSQNVVHEMFSLTLFLAVIGISGSIVLSRHFALSIVDPIQEMENAMNRVEHGDLTVSVLVRSNDELGLMAENFNKMMEVLRERYRIRQSLNMAMEVQQNLLPREIPRIQGIDIAGACHYCDETGGDFFDVYVPDLSCPDRFSVVVGDVSDHGIPSALIMTTARALLRMRSSMSDDVSQTISDVNRQLCRDVEDSGRFMTLFYAEVDRSELRLRWVNAGHDPAFLLDPDSGEVHELKGVGMALGVFDSAAYVPYEREITPGQILVIGTDGIWETHNPDGEMFGKGRLKATLRNFQEAPATQILGHILTAADRFRQSSQAEDDVTLVVIKIQEMTVDTCNFP